MGLGAVNRKRLEWLAILVACIWCLAEIAPSLAQTNAPPGKLGQNQITHADVWGPMFQSQAKRCWKKPHAGADAPKVQLAFRIKLMRDGKLDGMPAPEDEPATPNLRLLQESALRAIVACQPYNLPAVYFDEWKDFVPVFVHR